MWGTSFFADLWLSSTSRLERLFFFIFFFFFYFSSYPRRDLLLRLLGFGVIFRRSAISPFHHSNISQFWLLGSSLISVLAEANSYQCSSSSKYPNNKTRISKLQNRVRFVLLSCYIIYSSVKKKTII